jgi:hypothetical protein
MTAVRAATIRCQLTSRASPAWPYQGAAESSARHAHPPRLALGTLRAVDSEGAFGRVVAQAAGWPIVGLSSVE